MVPVHFCFVYLNNCLQKIRLLKLRVMVIFQQKHIIYIYIYIYNGFLVCTQERNGGY